MNTRIISKWLNEECGEIPRKEIAEMIVKLERSEKVIECAIDLYDNRLGWSDGRNPYAPPCFWNRLRDAFADAGR